MTNTPTTKLPFVDMDNARVDEQRAVMQEIAEQGVCPFCIEHLETYHPQPWIKNGQYWLVTKNRWPYEHTRHQLLFIYKKHAERFADLEPAAGEELFQFVRDIEQELQIPGGGLSIRFGDTQYSAGSVNHLHAQLIVPDATAPDFKPVRVKLGKDPAGKQSV